jgi:uncharacterized protein (TIGR04255 family)
MTTSQIDLYAGDHAIEVETFAVVFRSQIDSGDEARFEERKGEILDFFGSIDAPNYIELSFGDTPSNRPVMRQLLEFARDGTPSWSAQFGENAVALACRKYTGWQEVWPQVQERLSVLLSCVDPFKPVRSIEYTVTDNLREKLKKDSESELRARHIFRDKSLVPSWLLSYDDARWDFQSGRFIDRNEEAETLERIEAKSVISAPEVITTITNTFSYRYRDPLKLKQLFDGGETLDALNVRYNEFHEKNKDTVRGILVDELLERMGLT